MYIGKIVFFLLFFHENSVSTVCKVCFSNIVFILNEHSMQVLGVKQQEVMTPCQLTNMSYLVASMSGVLTAHSMRASAPAIAKRALGPHLGDFYEKHFPYWKCPKIFCNTRKDRKEVVVDKVKVSSGIAGLMTYDPGRCSIIFEKCKYLNVLKNNTCCY